MLVQGCIQTRGQRCHQLGQTRKFQCQINKSTNTLGQRQLIQASADASAGSSESGSSKESKQTTTDDVVLDTAQFAQLTDEELRQQARIEIAAETASLEDFSKENNPYGLTKGTALLLFIVLPFLLYGLYLLLEQTGLQENQVLAFYNLLLLGGFSLLWILSYAGRVFTKNTTYSKQLKAYEDQVMVKRLEEMTAVDLRNLLAEVEAQKRSMTKEEFQKLQETQAQGEPLDKFKIAVFVAGFLAIMSTILFNGNKVGEFIADKQQARDAYIEEKLAEQRREIEATTQKYYSPPTREELGGVEEDD